MKSPFKPALRGDQAKFSKAIRIEHISPEEVLDSLSPILCENTAATYDANGLMTLPLPVMRTLHKQLQKLWATSDNRRPFGFDEVNEGIDRGKPVFADCKVYEQTGRTEGRRNNPV